MKLDPDTPRDQALAAIETAGAAFSKLIDLWRERPNVEALAEVAEQGNAGPRKAARRALNVLKSRGVEVPKRRRRVQPGPTEQETLQAWMLAPDPAHNVLFVVARRAGTGRYHACLVFLNDTLGVSRISVNEYSQTGLKKALQQVLPSAQFKPTVVDVGWARYRIKQALDTQKERGLVAPLGLTSAAALLNPVPDEEVPHPLDNEGLELSLDDSRSMSENSGELHGLPEFRGWLPPKRAVDEMLLEVGKTLTPGEAPDQEKLQETLQAQVIAATDRYFSPQARERLLKAMKDSALSILAREGEGEALRVVALMNCIENAGLITDPPSDIPFLKGFFDKAVAVLLAEGKGSLKIPIPNAAAPGQPQAGQPDAEPSPS
jgi:hypothetical protein